jgi:hypothetical protein
MQTNKVIDTASVLHAKGEALIKAAHEYWQQYTKDVGGPAAVVWLEMENGHFVLFTRSEYRQSIIAAANRERAGEVALFKPFEKHPTGKEGEK